MLRDEFDITVSREAYDKLFDAAMQKNISVSKLIELYAVKKGISAMKESTGISIGCMLSAIFIVALTVDSGEIFRDVVRGIATILFSIGLLLIYAGYRLGP